MMNQVCCTRLLRGTNASRRCLRTLNPNPRPLLTVVLTARACDGSDRLVTDDPMAFEFIQGLKGSLWPLFTVPPTSMELILRSPRLLQPASSCASTPETCHNTAVDDAAGEQASGDHRQREGASSRGSRRRGPASAEAPTMLSRMREVAGSQQRGLSSAQARTEEGLASEGQPHVEVPQQVLLGLLEAVRELSEAVALVRAQKSARLHSACHGCCYCAQTHGARLARDEAPAAEAGHVPTGRVRHGALIVAETSLPPSPPSSSDDET